MLFVVALKYRFKTLSIDRGNFVFEMTIATDETWLSSDDQRYFTSLYVEMFIFSS